MFEFIELYLKLNGLFRVFNSAQCVTQVILASVFTDTVQYKHCNGIRPTHKFCIEENSRTKSSF